MSKQAKTGVYYLSFCDTTKPKGEQFLGATVVEAASAKAAHAASVALGVNPGGEIAMMRLSVKSAADLPLEARSFLNRFVPRDEVMAGGGATTEELGIEPTATVCQHHNP